MHCFKYIFNDILCCKYLFSMWKCYNTKCKWNLQLHYKLQKIASLGVGGKTKFIHLCTTLRVLAQKCPKRKAHKLSATKCEHSLWSTGHTTHLWLADRSQTNLWVLLSSPMKPVSDPKKPNLFFETEVKCNLDQNFN